MYAIDFEYDGQYLSDYGFIICKFDVASGANVADAGSKITFNKVSRNNGKTYSLTSTKYGECIQCTFDICKNPDLYDYEHREITNDEHRDLMRWLNRKEFLKFRVFYDNENSTDVCYYNASFNISKIKISEKTYGLQLLLESDKPFGYGEERSYSWTFLNENDTKILNDVSDEIGYIYPDMIITCNSNGDLSIFNESQDCTMVVKNCSIGEIIYVNGKSQTISTTYYDHDICKDFNYDFFKIGNTYKNRINKISVSMSCHIVMKYNPIVKDTL